MKLSITVVAMNTGTGVRLMGGWVTGSLWNSRGWLAQVETSWHRSQNRRHHPMVSRNRGLPRLRWGCGQAETVEGGSSLAA
jgi:hypothetical protein